MAITPFYFPQAKAHLRANDMVMRALIDADDEKDFYRSPRSGFEDLTRAIVGQQISVKAAASVWTKVCAAMGKMTPQGLLALEDEALRACGLSRQKIAYVQDIARHAAAGKLETEAMAKLDDEAAIRHLIQIKGVGRWTAQMYLMGHLLRPDVLPVGDLGFQNAIAKFYSNGDKLTDDMYEALAEPWRPYRSVAACYLWRALDNSPVEY